MITRSLIKRILGYGLDASFDSGSLEAQVASSLMIYVGRGEFDGSIESACECLEMAGYEIQGDV